MAREPTATGPPRLSTADCGERLQTSWRSVHVKLRQKGEGVASSVILRCLPDAKRTAPPLWFHRAEELPHPVPCSPWDAVPWDVSDDVSAHHPPHLVFGSEALRSSVANLNALHAFCLSEGVALRTRTSISLPSLEWAAVLVPSYLGSRPPPAPGAAAWAAARPADSSAAAPPTLRRSGRAAASGQPSGPSPKADAGASGMTGTTPTGGGGIGGGGGGGAGGGADRDGGGGAPSIGPARTGADAEAAEGNHAGAAPRPDASAAGADEGEDEEAGTWGEEDEGGGHDGEGEEDGDGDRDEDGAWGQEEDGQAVESSEPEPAPPEPCFDLYFLPGYPASAEAAAAEAVGGITLLQGGREVILLGSDSASENEQVEEVEEEEVEVDGGAEEQADLQDSDVQEVEPAAAERVTRPRCQALNTSWLRRRLSAAAVTAAAAAAACTGAVTGRDAAAAGPTSGGSGRARGAGAGAGASGGGSSAAVCVDEADVARWRRHWAQFPTDRETGLPVETGNVRFYGTWDPTTSAHATRQAGSGGPPVMPVSVTPSVLPGGWFHYSNRPWRSARPRGDCGGGGGSDGPEPVTTDLQTGFLQPCSCHPGTCGNEEARRALKLARARGACCALEVRPHEDRRRGLGVYAGAAGVAAGEYVAEYTGVLLGEEEAADREELYERHDLHFLFDVQPTANRSNRRRPPTFTAIDATLVGNVARFVNHSCDPNLEVVNVCPGGVKGESHHSLLFHCCRAIHPGREATISYYGRISDEWRTALRRLVPDAAGDGAAAAAASGAGAAGPSGAGSGPEGGAEGRGGARRGGRGSRGRGRGRRGRGRRGGGGGGRGGAAPVLGPLTREQALAAGYIECSCGAENCVWWLFVQGAVEGPKGPSQPTGTSEPGPEPQPDAEPDPDWNPDRSPDAGPSDSSDGAGRDKDWRPERKAARSSGGAEAAGGDGGEADGEGHREGGAERRQGSSGSAGTGSGRVRKRRRD